MITLASKILLTTTISAIDQALFQAANAIVGRSSMLDETLVFLTESAILTTVVVGTCFVIAWFLHGADPKKRLRTRKILLITIVASIVSIALDAKIAERYFVPRPIVMSNASLILEGGQLVRAEQIRYRVPTVSKKRETISRFSTNSLNSSDLGSFPSTHAALFLTLSVGLLLASKPIGMVALLWTVFGALGPRIVIGLNTPLDILAGGIIGFCVIAVCMFLLGVYGRRSTEAVAGWTLRHSVFASIVVAGILFDATNMYRYSTVLISAIKGVGRSIL